MVYEYNFILFTIMRDFKEMMKAVQCADEKCDS